MDDTRDTSSNITESVDTNEGFAFTFYDPAQATNSHSHESSIAKIPIKVYEMRDVIRLDKCSRPASRSRVITDPSPNIKPTLSYRNNDSKLAVSWSQKGFEALKYLKIEAKDFRIKPTKIDRIEEAKLNLKKSVSLENEKFSGRNRTRHHEALDDFLKPLQVQHKCLPSIFKPSRTNSARRVEGNLSNRIINTIKKRNASERSRNVINGKDNECFLNTYRKHVRERMVSYL